MQDGGARPASRGAAAKENTAAQGRGAPSKAAEALSGEQARRKKSNKTCPSKEKQQDMSRQARELHWGLQPLNAGGGATTEDGEPLQLLHPHMRARTYPHIPTRRTHQQLPPQLGQALHALEHKVAVSRDLAHEQHLLLLQLHGACRGTARFWGTKMGGAWLVCASAACMAHVWTAKHKRAAQEAACKHKSSFCGLSWLFTSFCLLALFPSLFLALHGPKKGQAWRPSSVFL